MTEWRWCALKRKIGWLAAVCISVLICGCADNSSGSASQMSQGLGDGDFTTGKIPALSGTNSANGRVRIITETENLTENLTVDTDEDLVVKDGGLLFIDSCSAVTLRGTLTIEQGGAVYVCGQLDCTETSAVTNKGKLKIMENGLLNLCGKLYVAETAAVTGDGTLNVINAFSDIECEGTVTAKIKAPRPVELDGVTYVGGVLLVNKRYALPEAYGTGQDFRTYNAYLEMKKESGFEMKVVSGFRSYRRQAEIFEEWCSIDGYDKASEYSAQAGHSEHQTGLAIDISSLDDSYADTDEGRWLAENCHRFGFIIRYPKGKTDITGYVYEPWHIRYLGRSTAKLVFDSGLTLEEFLGVA